jgi:hypothetical protein
MLANPSTLCGSPVTRFPKEIGPHKFRVEFAWIFKDAAKAQECRKALIRIVGHVRNGLWDYIDAHFHAVLVVRVQPAPAVHVHEESRLIECSEIGNQIDWRLGHAEVNPRPCPMMVINHVKAVGWCTHDGYRSLRKKCATRAFADRSRFHHL